MEEHNAERSHDLFISCGSAVSGKRRLIAQAFLDKDELTKTQEM
jgi:hypothetical protein